MTTAYDKYIEYINNINNTMNCSTDVDADKKISQLIKEYDEQNNKQEENEENLSIQCFFEDFEDIDIIEKDNKDDNEDEDIQFGFNFDFDDFDNDLFDNNKKNKKKKKKKKKDKNKFNIESLILRNIDDVKHYNIDNNWCDYCNSNTFIHPRFINEFMRDCINKYLKRPNIFMKSFDSYLLNIIVSLYSDNKEEFKIICYESDCMKLFGYLTEKSNRFFNNGETILIVIKSVIQSFIENLKNKDLKTTNIRCDGCNFLACPFHLKHGEFKSVDFNNISNLDKSENTLDKKPIKYCCGWCVDRIK